MKETLQKLLDAADIRVNGDRPWDIRVHDERLWRRAFLYGNNGLGDGYVDGWWDCRAIDEMLCRLLRVVRKRNRRPWRVVLPGYVHSLLVNLQSLRRAFQVGEHHYDIGNALYRAMLGEQMVYSCAYWQAGAGDLDQAQEDKLELVCRKLRLERGQRVLDIGCGWGSFCRYAAENHGVECVGLTVSKEQAAYARRHLEELPVEILLQDYREHQGQFDRIVSIGMFEHVGPRNYRTFMKVARRNLKPEGLFLLHTIGCNKPYLAARSWINRNIFPNGHIPAPRQVGKAMEGLFVAEDLHNFGPDYDRTLMAWYHNFRFAWPVLRNTRPQYTDRFYRMWTYYLLSCAAAFRARDLQLWQWVLSIPGRRGTYNRPALTP